MSMIKVVKSSLPQSQTVSTRKKKTIKYHVPNVKNNSTQKKELALLMELWKIVLSKNGILVVLLLESISAINVKKISMLIQMEFVPLSLLLM